MKSIKDFNIFSKIFLHQRSFFNKINIPWRIFYEPRQKLKRGIDTDFEELNSLSQKYLETPLYTFKHEVSLIDWIYTTDQDIGGQSKAELFFNEENRTIVFRGIISDENSDLLRQRMYACLQSYYFSRLNISSYNGLQIRVKTDGNLYKILLKMKSQHDNQHQAYAFIIDTSQEWQTLEIPFGRFLLEKERGYDDSMFLSQITEDIEIESLGILLESEIETDFQIEIQDIKLVYNKDFQKLQEYYMRPFFFYKQQDYENSAQLDTGKEVLHLKQRVQDQKQQENLKSKEQQNNTNLHSVNNFFDKDKGQKIKSFNEYLKNKKK